MTADIQYFNLEFEHVETSILSDLIVADEFFREYKKRRGWKLKNVGGGEMLMKDDAEMGANWGLGEWDINQLIENADIIEGLLVVILADVVQWKKILDREKGIQYIKLIENYLKQKFKNNHMAKS